MTYRQRFDAVYMGEIVLARLKKHKKISREKAKAFKRQISYLRDTCMKEDGLGKYYGKPSDAVTE